MTVLDDGALAMATIEHAAKLSSNLMETTVAAAIMSAAGNGISQLEAQALRLEGRAITAAFHAQVWGFHAKLATLAKAGGITLPPDASGGAAANLAALVGPIQPDGGGR